MSRNTRERSEGVGVLVAGIAALVAVGSASAQLTAGAQSAINNYGDVGGASFANVDHQWGQIGGGGAGFLGMSQEGMWTVGPFAGDTTGSVRITSRWDFGIGAVPVVVTDMALDWQAKWVNGGGSPFSTFTSPKISLTIYEAATNIPVIRLEQLMGFLAGNFFAVLNGNAGWTPNYILAANTNYRLELQVKTLIDHTAFVGVPAATVTNEFGPAFGFDGFRGAIGYQAIPSPGGLGLLALVGAAVRRRRCA